VTFRSLLFAAVATGALSFAAVYVTARPDAAPTLGPAPDVAFDGPDGRFRLADERGHPVVLQFAPADSLEAWAVLAEAYAHLEAVGAVVLGVATAGDAPESPFAVGHDPGAHAAEAFGYDGRPLTVVVDATGRLRGHASPRDAAAVYALAAPVLLETEAAGLESVTLDLRPADQRAAEGRLPRAIVSAPDALTAADLPADLAVPLVVVGPDAEAVAARVREWGYPDVQVLGDAGVLDDEPLVEPLVEDAPARPSVRG
jgi:peroxiredoxin